MHGPPLVAWLLVALSAAAGASCLLRRQARDEALMGLGMAVMAVPVSVFDPRPWGTPVFAAVFALASLRALLLARRSGHHLHHSVSSAAMVYMTLAMAGAGSGGAHAEHAGHGPAGAPLLTGALLLYFAAYVLVAGMRLVTAPGHAPDVPRAAAAPLPYAIRLRASPLLAPAALAPAALAPAVAGFPAATVRIPLRHAPEVAAACRVSMALGMFAMLLAL
jgi:hypothetical protein